MKPSSPESSDVGGDSPGPSQNSMSIPHRPHRQQKRRRDTQTGGWASRRRTASPEPEDNFGYDPDQPIEERRKIQKDLRNLHNEVTDRADELVQPASTAIGDYIQKANQLSIHFKQTSEALYDSRLLLQVSEIVTRKTQNLTRGGLAQGLDLDGFISKSVSYMRHAWGLENDGAPQLSSTQRQRRHAHGSGGGDDDDDDDDEIGDDGDMLHWEHYGQFASLPHIGRPALPGFLIGPLSVEKKVRRVTQRAARFRPNDLEEVKPQLIHKEDLGRNEKNDLTAACQGILDRLEEYVNECQTELENMPRAGEDKASLQAAMDRLGIHAEGDVDLLKFAINPHSFGQTVENLFYISFLIRDKKIQVDFDKDGFATIFPHDANDDGEGSDVQEGGEGFKQRRQAVFTIDMDLWREAIRVFGIEKPLIPHRKEETNHAPGARGWYG